MSEKIIEIPTENWPELRDLYLSEWPVNMLGYYTVDNFIKWVEKEPDIKNLHVYSLNGDWSDGTFAIVVSVTVLY